MIPEKVRNYMDLAEEQMALLTQAASQTLSIARTSPTPRPADISSFWSRSGASYPQKLIIQDLPPQIVLPIYAS